MIIEIWKEGEKLLEQSTPQQYYVRVRTSETECLTEVFNHEPTIEDIKTWFINNVIKPYDNTNAVNSITIKHGDVSLPYWLERKDRAQMESSVKNMMDKGDKTYRLDFREQGFTLEVDCEKLIAALETMEYYATQCYRVTTDHIFAVNKLTTIEEVLSYDYKAGYPDNPTIEL